MGKKGKKVKKQNIKTIFHIDCNCNSCKFDIAIKKIMEAAFKDEIDKLMNKLIDNKVLSNV
jgi:hypothetical protein